MIQSNLKHNTFRDMNADIEQDSKGKSKRVMMTMVWEEKGHRVGDVAVVILADYPIESELTVIPLTSISMDYERQGYEAAKLLDTLMAGTPIPEEP